MATDALARRLRFAPPDPKAGDMIYPQAADHEQWAAVSCHGPLPITYLQRFGERRNRANIQRRYTRFYHHGWVSRPPRQYASFHARYSPLVYDLTPKSKAELGDNLCPHPPSRTASFIHQLMQACFTASLEILAPSKGFRFVPRCELLEHEKCRQKDLILQVNGTRLIPDDLFALERLEPLPNGKRPKRIFLLEVDRNTESIERHTGQYNTWAKKIAAYDEMFRQGLHQQAWGFPKATVFTVTTNIRHKENLEAFVKERSKFPDRYQFEVEETFAANWRVPKELLTSAQTIL